MGTPSKIRSGGRIPLMAQSHFRSLIQKSKDGTLSNTECVQLREILREQARNTFEICPACGGAFSAANRLDKPIHCPLCEMPLVCWSSDLAGHHADEIDPSLAKSQFLGEFATGYSFPGVVPCLQCGTLFPKGYSCCPRLLCEAADYFAGGGVAERTAAVTFINAHTETLLNVLRCRFVDLFTPRQIGVLDQVAPFAERGLELGSVLNGIRGKAKS